MAGILSSQTPPAEAKDPWGRTTPQDSVFQFLEACHARDYAKAVHYLDLRQLQPASRAKDGPELARQLEDLLDDTEFEITSLSRVPEGDQASAASPDLEHLDTFHVDGQSIELQLARIELKPGFHVWVVSAGS